MKVYSIGSATLDVFFIFDDLIFLKNPIFLKEKNEVKKIFIDIGGGGLNFAYNFKNLGLNSIAIIKLGKDFVGKIIKNRIDEKNIDCIIRYTKGNSALSFIFLSKKGEKYIFTYRGAEVFNKNDIIYDRNSAYLISTGNTSLETWLYVVNKLKKNNNIIGIVPSKHFLSKKEAIEILNKINFFTLNLEEAKILLKTKENDEIIIAKKLKDKFKKTDIILLTLGEKGTILIKKENIYLSEAYRKFKTIDTTGAGDSYASTFFSILLKNNWRLEENVLFLALKLSAVNVAYNLREIGAQTGLLKEKDLIKFKNISLNIKNIVK
jgi:sugar/nucleoside kinase (ribokinase family)